MVSSSFPPPKQLPALDTNRAVDTFCSTLISCLDTICPLSYRQARATPSAPCLTGKPVPPLLPLVLQASPCHPFCPCLTGKPVPPLLPLVLQASPCHPFCPLAVWCSPRTLFWAQGCWKSNNSTDLNVNQSLLSSFSANVSTAKRTYYHNKMNNSSNSRMLIKTFSSLLSPPPPPPSSTLTADHFATFFINTIKTISAQLSTPQSVKHILPANINSFTSFSSFSEVEVSKLIPSNHPTTCPLDPIPSHLLQAISPAVVPALTHIVNTSLHTGVFPSAFRQARITPLLKKPTLNPTLLENYWPVSLFSFIAETLERAVFNQVSAFLSQSNLLDSNHSLVSEVDIQPRLGVMNQLTFSDHISKLPGPAD